MSLDKGIKYGKEHRKPYRGAKAFDPCCRNHGADECCKSNRTIQRQRAEQEADAKIKEAQLDELVRCECCTFYEEAHYENEGETPYVKHVCRLMGRQMQPDDFCSYAEKKTQGEAE